MSKKLLITTLACIFSLGSVGCTEMKAQQLHTESPRNVIMMVMDGTSSGAVTLARWYKGRDLALDQILTGGVRTYSAESAITDSAAAATALATGNKTDEHYIGLLPSKITTPGKQDENPKHALMPVANVLEGAKQVGKATGIVATSEIQHATPAGFSTHVMSRKQEEDIAEQQVYQGIDIVLGGGNVHLTNRKDQEDLQKVIKEKGYQMVNTRSELQKANGSKIWGSFAEKSLAYDIDRPATQPSEPTLAEMTNKAIQTLSKDEDGFFLFVEGSKIDWAAHKNDIVGMISDVLAFDEAVKEAVTFAERDGNTMVIAVTDHGNSGISIGNQQTSRSYAHTPVENFIQPLKKAKRTVEGALQDLKQDRSNIKQVAKQYGLDDLSNNEVRMLINSDHVGAVLAAMLAKEANLGFTTWGHTGEDVFLYAYGPSHPSGYLENTALPEKMAEFMGVNLEKLSQSLFINAKETFEKQGFVTKIDQSKKYNPVFVATKKGASIEIPANKNIITVNGKSHSLDGVSIFNGRDFFVSEQVKEFLP
ncbi:alkaline phosphatase [Robertmurraya korlensis]|uniref:alkaline phosphatase n=1 Tax=Robertmurraya korlensis TaxID=519977 RepID=UPI00203A3C3B|nr:alkaline phosphatase [Robertmurraya korlensis]MCM3602522.1 alkaline phosphatase [Robertmurraya korlensis]